MTEETLALIMFGTTLILLMFGFPVALTLAGSALLFAFLGEHLDLFLTALLGAYPQRVFGIMITETFVAVPLFIFMGVMLERSRIAGDLLDTLGLMFGTMRGGLGFTVIIVGTLLAASTGIVGATVVTMGLLSLPPMMRAGYNPKLATGIINASGTLGQIIPPSIVLIILADVLQGANEHAGQLRGDLAPEPVTGIDLFAGSFFPGLMLVAFYTAYMSYMAIFKPESCPALVDNKADKQPMMGRFIRVVVPPILLITLVLGSIMVGAATPTESAAVGAIGATLIAISFRRFTFSILSDVAQSTLKVSSMVFVILIGASMFSLVFRGFGGDEAIERFLATLPGGAFSAMLLVMVVIFFLGFFLDFIEIIFVVIPIVAPILIALDFSPLWLGVMVGINLQTSFLTPPFGFALFYLRGVAPAEIRTIDIYKGVIPFIFIQITALIVLSIFPSIATWLPTVLFR
jgi:tripartite ATP-independent transporter DctM subunit